MPGKKSDGWKQRGKVQVRMAKNKPVAKPKAKGVKLTGQAGKAAKNIVKSANKAKKY